MKHETDVVVPWFSGWFDVLGEDRNCTIIIQVILNGFDQHLVTDFVLKGLAQRGSSHNFGGCVIQQFESDQLIGSLVNLWYLKIVSDWF